MAYFHVMSGGCVCVGTDSSYASVAERASDETDFRELYDYLEKDKHLNDIEEKVKEDGLEFDLSVADCDDGCWLVVSVGKKIHKDTYILHGEIRTLDHTLSDEQKINVVKHLEQIENHLRDLGHGTEQQLGIVFNHFD
jgi:hypothetical protein